MLQIESTAIPDVLILTTRWFEDERGAFTEAFNADRWEAAGLVSAFTQDAQSLSRPVGTVRGLHFQRPPMAQTKIIRILRGALWDVAVDIRVGSPTYGKWVGVELSAANRRQLYIPQGFAHGFVTLEPDTEALYKLGANYSPEHESGIRWDDPTLGIDWPLPVANPVISERDANFPSLNQLEAHFHYAP